MNKEVKAIVDKLLAQGWTVETDANGHYTATPPDKTKRKVTIPSKPNKQNRGWKNMISALRRSGADL